MIHFNYHSLLIASTVLFGGAISANAQLVDVLTEAPVTIQASITSTVTTTTPTAITITPTTVRLTNLQVIQELVDSSIIPDSSAAGWSLVAVRNVPADLPFVDAGFYLYAIKDATVVAIPSSKFASSVGYSVARYSERNQGRYIYSSSGTITNHVLYSYTPTFSSSASNVYSLLDSESSGFASVKYSTKNASDDYEIFFYGISSISAITQGGYSGSLTQDSNPSVPSSGLFTLTITVGAPKLVRYDKYPDVSPAMGPSTGP
ncbi:MAG TPA: hypothetical protein VL357_03255 [Rariglobus sp.]|jgi:hypothetical protein|nr:hypothetical protein [Rariglobus sp.]